MYKYKAYDHVLTDEGRTPERGRGDIFRTLDGHREGMISTRHNQRQWVSIRHEGPESSENTVKTEGGCHWGACLTDGASEREQAMHRVRLTSGMRHNEGIIIA